MFNFIKYFLNLILCLPLSSSCFRSSPEQVLNSGSKPSNHAFAKQSIKSWLAAFLPGTKSINEAGCNQETNQWTKQRLAVIRKRKSTNQAEPACIPEANRPIKQSLLVFRKQIDQSSRACLYSGSKSTNQAVPSCVPESNQAVKQELSVFRKTNYN